MTLFVGREPELATPSAALDRALAGTGGLALVAGEPGIGKTTLVGRIAALAAARGAHAHWGRCVDFEGAPVYWCWRQIIRDWADGLPSASIAEILGTGAADVARMVPEVAGALGVKVVDGQDDDEDTASACSMRWRGGCAGPPPSIRW